ncbi:MAG TPA: hypothetical protein VFL42_05115, partial [Terriglobales bacterium]|nr:hypothetical protein [Terriglobales bacterium]
AHACLVPRDFGAGPSQLPPQLSGKVSGPNRDQVEINRCHALIDPACDMRLLQALTFELPQEKLAVPRFHMTNARRDAGLSRKDSGLSEDERNSIQESLSQQRARRGKARPESARVTVDGTERARVQLTQRNKTAFVIQEGAELIELWGECEGEDLLLAVHPVAYAEAQIAAQNAVAFESRGRRLELAIVPEPPAGDALGRATVTLDSRPGLIGWLPQPTAWSWAAGQAVAAAVFLGIGWMLGARFPQAPPAPPLPASIATSIQPANAAEEKTAAQASSAAAHRYRLVPDELVTRGGQGPQLPFVSLPGENGVVSLELPIGQEHSNRSFRARMKRFEGRLEILTENLLSARPSGSGWVVDFPVPASLLHGNQDYSVDLLLHGPPGMVEELTSYTFHTK